MSVNVSPARTVYSVGPLVGAMVAAGASVGSGWSVAVGASNGPPAVRVGTRAGTAVAAGRCVVPAAVAPDDEMYAASAPATTRPSTTSAPTYSQVRALE